MKPFQLEPSMVTMSGVFYPTGHMVLMFPSDQDARDGVRRLTDAGIAEDEVSLLTPEAFQQDIVRTIGNADSPLPSAGTEADTVRKFAELASQGHYALVIHAPDAADSDRVMAALAGAKISYGQKYRMLVIEDLVN